MQRGLHQGLYWYFGYKDGLAGFELELPGRSDWGDEANYRAGYADGAARREDPDLNWSRVWT